MSTLKVTNIQSNGSGFNDLISIQNSSGTQNGALCRAWLRFNGSGQATIQSSFNVSSISRWGSGRYQVNFANSLPDANYVLTGTGIAEFSMGFLNDATLTSSGFRFLHGRYGQDYTDSAYLSLAIFR